MQFFNWKYTNKAFILQSCCFFLTDGDEDKWFLRKATQVYYKCKGRNTTVEEFVDEKYQKMTACIMGFARPKYVSCYNDEFFFIYIFSNFYEDRFAKYCSAYINAC